MRVKGEEERSLARVKNRLIEIERKMEMREKEERRKNIIIKGVEVKNGRRREAVKEVLKRIGVKADMEEVKKLRSRGERGRDATSKIKRGRTK